MNKNKDLLASFSAYCKAHPEQRFWQALRNWSAFAFIYAGYCVVEAEGLKDTFYMEGYNE